MTTTAADTTQTAAAARRLKSFASSSSLGVTCFGGPIAHIGYFREEFVRTPPLDRRTGLCRSRRAVPIPAGPASSQVGFSIGLMRAGYRGGLAAWTGFTLPSAIALVLFAYGAGALSGPVGIGTAARPQASRRCYRRPSRRGAWRARSVPTGNGRPSRSWRR